MGGNDGKDIALSIEFQLVDTYLTIKAVDRFWIVVTMIYDEIASILLQNGVMSWAVHGLVLIRCQQFAFVLERSHRSCGRCGILHPIGVSMAGSG